MTLIELTNYQCTYCQRFFHDTYPHIKESYIDTGKLRLDAKDLPLKMHPNARKAAQAASPLHPEFRKTEIEPKY